MAYVGNFGVKGGNGYSVEGTKNFFGTEVPKFRLISSKIQVVNKWDNSAKRYSDEPDHDFVVVADDGIEPFRVKLPVADENGEKTSLNGAKFLDYISFVDLETYRRGSSQVYFRAQAIKKVKA
ncbi:hypothetical protein [Limosilactobacillus reuteri]|uniref:hypothetical protein n=1 Tax=Limosilactobacillus reuteri TaxID=1598 RepID=UPI001E3AF84E|nr:hypothetical protein [Limosilactobacillus reuteri]MCC4361947.1 hypothetical protein [Limosilactobacillus reuteri]MCC4363769.1 hypothetical protein [Limosilactobacillus reuteri]